MVHTILGHFDLNINFWPHLSGAYLLYYSMCLMLDQFLWGHSSRDCDISCSYFSTKTYVVGTLKDHLNEHPKHMFKLMD